MDMNTKKGFFPSLEDGHLSDEASAFIVEALLQGDITGAPDDALTHVEACRECKDKIMEVVTFRSNPVSAGTVGMHFAKKSQTRRDWLFYRGKIAAIFVVFALLAGAYLLIYKNPPLTRDFQEDAFSKKAYKTPLSNNSPSSPVEKTDDKKAPQENPSANGVKTDPVKPGNGKNGHSRFEVNPNLENMIGSHLRSGGIEVVTPANNSSLVPPIHFSWNRELMTPHTLKIVNNKNLELFTYTVQGNGFDFPGPLDVGLFYWKLENSNELLYVGKFFIGIPPASGGSGPF